MRECLPKVFIIGIGEGPYVIDLVDVSYYKGLPLSLTRNLNVALVLENLGQIYEFFLAFSPLGTCLLLGGKGSEEKDSVTGTSIHRSFFCKTSQYTQENTCAGITF